MTTTLSSLIKKINEFYRLATLSTVTAAPETYVSPDEDDEEGGTNTNGPGLYPKILDAARAISDPDIAAEVLLIAELYKKSIEVNGGFNFVNRGISNLVTLLDDDDDQEQSSVEDLLNEISRDLRTRAKSTGNGDNESAIRALNQTKNEINTRFIAEDLESDEPSAYEAGLTQYQEGAEGTFDFSGGVNKEVGQSKGRGYRIQTRTYKDWVQSFENERQRLIVELADPALQNARTGVEGRRNAAIRSNLEELITILVKMRDQTSEAIDLEAQISAAPDEQNQAKLAEIRESLKELQKKRVALKQNLRNHHLAQRIKDFELEMASTHDLKEKFLLEQKIELQKIMMSGEKGKGEEVKWRRLLINSMSNGNSLPPDQIKKIQQKIQEGAAKKTKITELYQQKAEQIAKLKGNKTPIRNRQVGQKGEFGKQNKYDFASISLDGLVEHLTQRMATERIVVKQKVTDKMKKAQQDPATLKPLMDDVAKAATKKDKAALVMAATRLKQKMVEFKNVQPEVVQYVISLRTSKFFYGFRDRVKKIGEWAGNELTPEQLDFIQDTIRSGIKLSEYYKSLRIKPMTPGWSERSTHYKPPTEIIDNIVQYLQGLSHE